MMGSNAVIMLKFNRLSLLILIVCTLFSGCNIAKSDGRKGELKVRELRRFVLRGEAEVVYERADPRFKSVVNKNKFVSDLIRNSEEIGNHDHFYVIRSGIHYDWNAGQLVLVQFKPVNESLSNILLEEYVFSKDDRGNLILFNYAITERSSEN